MAAPMLAIVEVWFRGEGVRTFIHWHLHGVDSCSMSFKRAHVHRVDGGQPTREKRPRRDHEKSLAFESKETLRTAKRVRWYHVPGVHGWPRDDGASRRAGFAAIAVCQKAEVCER